MCQTYSSKIYINLVKNMDQELIIIGGGLAGCEAAFQAAERGISVLLYEMRPAGSTPAHKTDRLGELVCSNSLGSLLPDRASGLLMDELSRLGSMLLKTARSSAVPSGSSLSVDRLAFSKGIEDILLSHPHIKVIREEITRIPDVPAVIASGPLTSPTLTKSIAEFTGQDNLFFFDALAPIIQKETIDMSIAFSGSRFSWEKGESADYINCPLSREEFDRFVTALVTAERIPLTGEETQINNGVKAGKGSFFEGCLPIEEIARRGTKTLCFGPMRPIGLRNPHKEERPNAILQLRQDNLSATLYNMVGFQTNLTYSEQERIFRMIPGLENAEFERFGQMHRNTFISSPTVLLPTLQTRTRPDLFFAGQLTGIEGYLGNIGSGLLAGINAANYITGKEPVVFPSGTMIGALCRYITESASDNFQPMKANFGLLPEPENRFGNRLERSARYVENAKRVMDYFLLNTRDVSGAL
jgi:methylenetetrahydrofolate--tRNA-(uracil-5-)-methyltransferase